MSQLRTWVLLMVTTTAASGAIADTETFFDSEMRSTEWTVDIVGFPYSGGSPSGSTSFPAVGGNPDAHLLHSHTDCNDQNQVISIATNSTAVMDPSAMGGILTIDFFVDVGVIGQGVGLLKPALAQNSEVFVVDDSYLEVISSEGWLGYGFYELGADSFRGADGVATPNFSASGSPITLGYIAGYTYCVTGNLDLQVDNWSAVVTTPTLEPVEISLVLRVSNVDVGESFDVDLVATGFLPARVGGLTTQIAFEPSLVAHVSQVAGPGLSLEDRPGVVQASSSSGLLDLTVVSTLSDASLTTQQSGGTATLATLTFQALQAGDALIGFSAVEVSDAAGSGMKITALTDTTILLPEPSRYLQIATGCLLLLAVAAVKRGRRSSGTRAVAGLAGVVVAAVSLSWPGTSHAGAASGTNGHAVSVYYPFVDQVELVCVDAPSQACDIDLAAIPYDSAADKLIDSTQVRCTSETCQAPCPGSQRCRPKFLIDSQGDPIALTGTLRVTSRQNDASRRTMTVTVDATFPAASNPLSQDLVLTPQIFEDSFNTSGACNNVNGNGPVVLDDTLLVDVVAKYGLDASGPFVGWFPLESNQCVFQDFCGGLGFFNFEGMILPLEPARAELSDAARAAFPSESLNVDPVPVMVDAVPNGALLSAPVECAPRTLQGTPVQIDPNTVEQINEYAVTVRFAEPRGLVPPAACDTDRDGRIGRPDVKAIAESVDDSALPGDSRDDDGNGTVDVLDARLCAIKCDSTECGTIPTQPRWASLRET